MVCLDLIDIGKKTKTDDFYDGATDFAKLTGICEDESYWVIKDDNKKALVNNNNELKDNTNVFFFNFGIRLQVEYKFIKNEARKIGITNEGKDIYEFGEYHSSIVNDKKLELKLENFYINDKLQKTGKKYTVDNIKFYRPIKKFLKKGIGHFDYDSNHRYDKFNPLEIEEYSFDGEKYIRYYVNENSKDINLYNKTIWIKVEPIKWTIEEFNDKKIAISNKSLISGIQFDTYKEKDYKLRTKYTNYESTNIGNFLNNYLSLEILPTNLYLKEISSNKDETIEKKNHMI